MTSQQQKKLEALIGKLEALQHEVKDETGLLASAKSDLIEFRKRENGCRG